LKGFNQYFHNPTLSKALVVMGHMNDCIVSLTCSLHKNYLSSKTYLVQKFNF